MGERNEKMNSCKSTFIKYCIKNSNSLFYRKLSTRDDVMGKNLTRVHKENNVYTNPKFNIWAVIHFSLLAETV